jgi:hypothetical protein
MSTDKPSIPLPVFLGHIFLIVTCVMYSIYWVIDYYATSNRFAPLVIFLFSGSILIGFIGIILFYVSSGTLPESNRVRHWPVVTAGIGLFVLSLMIMDKVFQRPFTSEIFFAFLWAIWEMDTLYSVYQSGRVPKAPFYAMAAGVLACTAINLACYRIHFQLSDFNRFINGLIPYLVAALFMTAVLIILFLNRNSKDSLR